MIDFTSALYLGIRHPSHALGSWEGLTTGVPAALGEPAAHRQVAQALADLQGCERGVLARSTLHLVWDLFDMWSETNSALFVDAGVYPITQWGVERAAGRGLPVRQFAHHDAHALADMLRREMRTGRKPIVVTDGWCPRCGRIAPLDAYLQQVRRYGGRLVLDDTQALGILGQRCKSADAPYGSGGGGSLRWFGIAGADIVVFSSLAKAFGVPLAVLSSSAAFIRRFKSTSETRVHTSPPSLGDVRAAQHALSINERCGAALRQRLASLVARLRQGLASLGLVARGNSLPVQTLTPKRPDDALLLYERLKACGVRAVLLREDAAHRRQLAVLLTARHRASDIDLLLATIHRSLPDHFLRHVKEHDHGMQLRPDGT